MVPGYGFAQGRYQDDDSDDEMHSIRGGTTTMHEPTRRFGGMTTNKGLMGTKTGKTRTTLQAFELEAQDPRCTGFVELENISIPRYNVNSVY